jgi:asparagine synthase (glutamine-hydrolysing)
MVQRGKLERMVQSMSHRGPDRSANFVLGNIGLGHAMLCIAPESLEEVQPYSEGDLTIVADARIDNRDELSRRLGLKETASDSHLILSAYRKWQDNCPAELLGDFSFAVWDQVAGRLFCARDHMGVRPFYYHQSSGIFTFASEIKGLLRLPEVPREIDEEMVANYLATVLDDRSITFYKGIRRLPAAHSIVPSSDPVKYWRLDNLRRAAARSDREYAEEFQRIFNEAVIARTRSAFPVGSTLSGGLDSSSVCCLASIGLSKAGKQLETFSAVFPDAPKCDETPYIKEVLSRGNMNPHFIRADRSSPFGEIAQIFDELDEPYWIPNIFWNREVIRSAGKANVRVLMGGFDGDTVVSHGFFLIGELFRSFRWLSLFCEIRGLDESLKLPAGRLLWSWCIAPLAPRWFARIWKKYRKHTAFDCSSPYFNAEFARRMDIKGKLDNREERRSHTDQMLDALDDGFLQYLMEAADHMSLAFSVEQCHPFFDRRLVEFSLSIPSDLRLKNGYSRWIMREALKGILPEKIRMRAGKANLSSNFNQQLIGEDVGILKDLALDEEHMIWKYASISEFRLRLEQIGGNPSNRDLSFLWSVANLALWLERFGPAHRQNP